MKTSHRQSYLLMHANQDDIPVESYWPGPGKQCWWIFFLARLLLYQSIQPGVIPLCYCPTRCTPFNLNELHTVLRGRWYPPHEFPPILDNLGPMIFRNYGKRTEIAESRIWCGHIVRTRNYWVPLESPWKDDSNGIQNIFLGPNLTSQHQKVPTNYFAKKYQIDTNGQQCTFFIF
jgi:hypothetical protein